VFTDGSSFELYGDAFTCCGGVYRTKDIERYVTSSGGKQSPPKPSPSTGTSPAPYCVPAGQTLEDLMTQDLAAWKMAKQAMYRAKQR
jgi:hypothetical protein